MCNMETGYGYMGLAIVVRKHVIVKRELLIVVRERVICYMGRVFFRIQLFQPASLLHSHGYYPMF